MGASLTGLHLPPPDPSPLFARAPRDQLGVQL